MLEGLYSAAAGMSAQQEQLDAISNDLANLSTNGYKAERVAFSDLLYSPVDVAATVSTDGADASGTLVNSQGSRLTPPIKLPPGVSAHEVSIAADGTVSVGTRKLGQIK